MARQRLCLIGEKVGRSGLFLKKCNRKSFIHLCEVKLLFSGIKQYNNIQIDTYHSCFTVLVASHQGLSSFCLFKHKGFTVSLQLFYVFYCLFYVSVWLCLQDLLQFWGYVSSPMQIPAFCTEIKFWVLNDIHWNIWKGCCWMVSASYLCESMTIHIYQVTPLK